MTRSKASSGEYYIESEMMRALYGLIISRVQKKKKKKKKPSRSVTAFYFINYRVLGTIN